MGVRARTAVTVTCRRSLFAALGFTMTHMFTRRTLLAAAPTALLPAAAPLAAESPADEIRAMLKASESAWNRGDLAAFAADYEDAPTTTFVGRELTRGNNAVILARYQRSYPTAESRGTLAFSEIEARTLGSGYALALGRFALQRTPAGGGDATGRFSLVLHRGPRGWKIIHDHSS
jgi:uncharacterized protein (TIGR02246 family)